MKHGAWSQNISKFEITIPGYLLTATEFFDLGCGIEELLGGDLFPDGSFERCNVDLTSEMNRALSVDGIPTGWIC